MASKFQLQIPVPCHENWDQMTQADKGRFCGSCQKQVIDFTSMTDREIAQFFKKPSKDSVCGRFMQDQLDKDLDIPRKRIPWLKYFFQFVLPAFLTAAKATAQGTIRVLKEDKVAVSQRPIVGDSMRNNRITSPAGWELRRFDTLPKAVGNGPGSNSCEPLLQSMKVAPMVAELPVLLGGVLGGINIIEVNPGKWSISGTVTDDNGFPVHGAIIVIKGKSRGEMTDENGKFTLKFKGRTRKATLIISAAGHETASLEVSPATTEPVIKLVPKISYSEAIVVVTAGMVIRKRVKSKQWSLLSEQRMNTATKFFKLFPNPVSPGADCTIEWNVIQEGYYRLQLTSLSGQAVHQREIWIDEAAKELTVNIPVVPAGTYILSFSHKATGKNYSEKIIIQ